jgi:hypothetical protein
MPVEYRFMASAAPFVKLLRQLSSAKDEYRSGAIDVTWDGGKASLYLVFGQPNHATFEGDDGQELEGQDALTAMVTQLPKKFQVSNWRKVVIRTETLDITLDELMEPFAQLAGAASEEEPQKQATAVGGSEVGTGFEADLDFGLEDFPLLPLGQSLWSDAAANVVHLDVLIPKLPDALVVLTGPKLRAAAIVVRKQIIDAVWVDDQEQALGEGAAMALMGARDGTVSGYKLDNSRLAEALTMLWRCPIQFSGMRTGWLSPDSFLEEIQREQRDCAIVVEGTRRGVALFMQGELVAAYSDDDRVPTPDAERIRALLLQPDAAFTYRQRAGDRVRGANLPEESFHTFVEGPGLAEALTGAAPEVQSAPAPATDANGSEPHAPAAEAAVAPEAPVAPVEEPLAEVPAAAEPEAPAEPEPAPAPAEAEQVAESPPELTADIEPVAEAEPLHEPSFGEHPGTAVWGMPEAEPAAAQETAQTDVWGLPPAAPEPEAEPATPAWGTREPEPAAEPDSALSSWGQAFEPDAEMPHEPAAPVAPSYDAVADPGEAQYAATAPDAFAWQGASYDEGTATAAAAAPTFFGDDTAAGSSLGGDDPDADGGDLDYDTVKADLIQIGVLWLGNDDVAPVAELIRKTRSSVDDFVATIDQIKVMAIAGHDPSVVRAMAREMHYHAAEYLCGA